MKAYSTKYPQYPPVYLGHESPQLCGWIFARQTRYLDPKP